ncbi:hypothetical protein H2198_007852 [Neophaeococcomyces mojaviensis]|uniref:Uncharacterized protein n=1 Tax=Neophaeococcomyces mojaviensis TaxID=3383035 RepID=A0ACC2ZYV7_9EURO|nr:hypothetical protein H2198_007852 [Knufia sp. JES_112]
MLGSYTVTRIPRKQISFIFLAFISLFLLYQLRIYSPTAIPSVIPSTSYKRPAQADDGRFHWIDRIEHYPLSSFTPLPSGKPKSIPNVQHKFDPETTAARTLRLERRDQIKETFRRCWSSYKERAWMRDELSPISGHGRDSFGGWAASLVDALDTLWIMDMKTEFHEAALATTDIDFGTSTDETVNIFETTIRYLGGFLSAYDLSGERQLLDRAMDIGDMLLVAFDTPNHFPITRWDWKMAADGQRQETPSGQLVSELGSLTLEFTRLSQLTGDQRFYDAIHRISDLFDRQQSKTKLPGLWPVVVNPKDEDLTSDTGFTLGGMSDSLYEYFPKQYALLGGLAPVYQKLYEQSMIASIDALFFRPMTPNEDDILISGDARATDDGHSYVSEPKGQHLGCFAGGMLGLGGRLFQNDEHVALGRKITDGCIWAYQAMERGVMPEIAHFVSCESKTQCSWDEKKWLAGVLERLGSSETTTDAYEVVKTKNLPEGFTSIDDSRYILRPEAIESVFIMYRITGDEKYRDAAWKMFTSINEVSKTEFANAAISDISVPKSNGAAPKDDRMESFWLAETLKYFYLIFSEPELISLDEFVLNTEAHPLRRPT